MLRKPFWKIAVLLVLAGGAAVLITWRSSPSGEKCLMCGRRGPASVAVTVTTTTGEKQPYCCPHCAIMQLSLAETPEANIQSVTLTDHPTGQSVAAAEAWLVCESAEVPCCAPSLLAFGREAAAQDFAADHGGTVRRWREAFALTLQERCRFCNMVVYPPTALRVTRGTEKGYGCCIMCAVGRALQSDETSIVRGACDACGQPVTLTFQGGKFEEATPATVTLWQGLKPQDGKKVPAGCHFNHVFCGSDHSDQWRVSHRDEDGRVLTPAEAAQLMWAQSARK